jgi:hypothetical protein
MPIPVHGGRDDAQAGAALLEYIGRKRLHQVRQRRQRRLIYTTAALGVLAAVLAASNVLLLKRLNAVPEASLPASAASPPLEAATEPATPAPPGPAPEPAAALPTAPTLPAPSPAPEQVAVAPGPATPAPGAAVAPPAPARSAVVAAVKAGTSAPVVEEEDSARRTARWLVRTHGLAEAENRVMKAAEFYSGTERQFWRRVLVELRQER